MQTGNRKQVFNEINITPLTDIFLVLLIIMMVVAPMMQQMRKDIKPPNIQSGTKVEQNKLTVEITKDGGYFVSGQQTSSDALTQTLQTQEKALVAKTSGDAKASDVPVSPDANEKNLIIRADKATKSGEVLKVFEAARDAGFTKVTVAGEPLTEERQSELQQQNAAGPMSSPEMGGAQ